MDPITRFHERNTAEAVEVLEAVLLFLHDRSILFSDCRFANLWNVISNTINKLDPNKEWEPEDDPPNITDNWLIDDYKAWWAQPSSVDAAATQHEKQLKDLLNRWLEEKRKEDE